MTQPGTDDTTGLDLFDFTASAVGSFPSAIYGYDRKTVDAYVFDLENKATQAKRELRNANNKIFRMDLLLDSGEFTKLGGYTSSILHAAEAQVEELVTNAHKDADVIKEKALTEARELKLAAEIEAARLREAGLAELKELRSQTVASLEQELTSARAQAQALIQAAEKNAATIVADAEQQAASITKTAAIAADHARRDAEKEAAEIRLAAARTAEETMAALKTEQAEAAMQVGNLMNEAKRVSAQFQDQVSRDSAELTRLRDSAYAEADAIKAQAYQEAQLLRQRAQVDADTLRDEVDSYAFNRKELLKREINLLEHRKQSIIGQLKNLSALAETSIAMYPKARSEIVTALDETAAEATAGSGDASGELTTDDPELTTFLDLRSDTSDD